ncbi:SPARC-related modular calcium-binding protein 1-like isoform X2 [Rhinichthys klamathensis goyatoka]|uniref:SPARC-related modular calcium-binding protein 1-like isoform X2 n=1 Tax=Rhinichthys klamathensis goyatoka TaxID=3034132 RepID=UPI0024B56388|nr:SPARC-related modular calcium-binding protein 1-like isoform X2 [Rhinichthys klamathensis goyatoka]
MLALTFTCRVLLIFLLSNSVKMTDENQLLVLDKQWPRVCVLDCARGRRQAVCGSNGRMYKSLCSFQRAQCINSQLRMDTLSTCTDALSSKCQLARSQALRASARSDSLAIFIPICDADGSYAEVQCHTQTGFCWCSSADGMPVSGSSVLHLRPNCTGQMSDIAQETDAELAQAKRGVPDPVPTTEGVTVPPFWVTILLNSDPNGKRPVRRPTDSLKNCEHERMSLLAEAGIQGSDERFIPECSADGRYKSVQCHSGTGYCWCVRVDSGRPIPGTSDRNQLPDCSSQETNTLIINNSYTETPLSGCSSVRKTDFLKSLIEAFQQEVESVAPSSPYRTPESRLHVPTSPPSVHTLRLYFMLLDTDGDGVLSEREARPLRLLLRRSLRPRRCAKKLMQSCDRNADRRLSSQELTSCLGI